MEQGAIGTSSSTINITIVAEQRPAPSSEGIMAVRDTAFGTQGKAATHTQGH